jgi:hypothetical protein
VLLLSSAAADSVMRWFLRGYSSRGGRYLCAHIILYSCGQCHEMGFCEDIPVEVGGTCVFILSSATADHVMRRLFARIFQ